MNIKLSNRLMSVAKRVPNGVKVADIGTDHGYLAVYLTVENVTSSVIATDRAKGPLAAATQLVELLSLGHEIEMRLGDGLQVLEPGEVDVVCIAGMGGMLIMDILEAAPDVVAATKRFIFQPMRGASKLRRYLVEHGFKIVDEDLCFEDDFYYVVIVAEPGEMELSDEEIHFGPLLLKNQHPLLKPYLTLKRDDLERLLEGMAGSNSDEAIKRKQQLRAEVEEITTVIDRIRAEQ